jgi:type VI secretion system secreted protein VgrG
MKTFFRLISDAIPSQAKVLSFQGWESLSQVYRYEVLVAVPHPWSASFDMDAAMGARATFEIQDDRDQPRTSVHGIVASLELVHEIEQEATFRVVLVPALWRLSVGFRSRMFTHQTFPDILDAMLRDAGLTDEDFELVFRDRSVYPELEHVCQFQESNLEFLSRWMENEGIYFFFRQDGQKEKAVFTDLAKKQSELDLGSVPYVTQGQSWDGGLPEGAHTFRCARQTMPAAVRLEGYNYLNPGLPVKARVDVGDGRVSPASTHGEGLANPADATRLAKVRSEELQARKVEFHAGGRLYRMHPGHNFTLRDHPRAAFDVEYLVVEATCCGSQSQAGDTGAGLVAGALPEGTEFDAQVKAIPASVPYRAPRVTARPRIDGLITARVDGPAEDIYAQLDEHGRYLVRIAFDESQLEDGKASTRVRMLQPHGGAPEGFHFPLRKGTEVLLAFLGGDPDLPVIVGVAPNAHTPSLVTSSNATENVLQSGGRNRLVMEDQDGSQYVNLSSPTEKTMLHMGANHQSDAHNLVLATDGTELVRTGSDRDMKIGGAQTEDVKGDLTETYHAKRSTHVTGAYDHTVDGGATETIHSGQTQTIDGGVTRTASGGETETVNGGRTQTINGGRTQTINGGSTETVNGALTQTITAGANITTPAAYNITATGGFKVVAPAGSQIIAPGGHTVIAPGGQRSVDSFFDKTGGKSIDAFAFRMSILGLKMDLIAGLTLTMATNKADVIGTKFDIAGTFCKLGAQKQQTFGIALLQAYINTRVVGLFIHI